MQFNSKITVTPNTYNDSGEEVAGTGTEIKCVIIRQSRRTELELNAKYKKYDAEVLIPYKAFAPYNTIMTDQTLNATLETVDYTIAKVDPIRSSSGKIKFFKVYLAEKK